MEEKIAALKVKIFDILEEQEKLNMRANQLEQMKRPIVDELNKLRTEKPKEDPAE